MTATAWTPLVVAVIGLLGIVVQQWRQRPVLRDQVKSDLEIWNALPEESSVRMDLLSASPKTDEDRACPHGVQFYDVAGAEGRSERAAWSYEKPTAPAIQRVDHWIGFWNDVELSS